MGPMIRVPGSHPPLDEDAVLILVAVFEAVLLALLIRHLDQLLLQRLDLSTSQYM